MNGYIEGPEVSGGFLADKNDSESGKESSSIESFFSNLINFDFKLNILSVKIKELTGKSKRNSLIVDGNVECHYLLRNLKFFFLRFKILIKIINY